MLKASSTDIGGTVPANKGWGFWKRLAIMAVGSMFGPVGAAIAGSVVDWGESRGWFNKGGNGPSQWALNKLAEWEETYFAVHYEKVLKATRGQLSQVTSPSNLILINNLLSEAYAWQAYYEHVAMRSTDEDEVELSTLKAQTISEVFLLVRYKWLETVQGFGAYPENFDPTSYKNVAGDALSWQGAKVSAERFYIADKPHGGLPPTGGNGGGTGTGTGSGGGTGTGTGTGSGGGTGTGTGSGGGTTTGNGGTSGGNGGTTTPPTGGNGGTKPPIVLPPTVQRPIEYFRLTMEEKYIYLDWEKTGNANFYYQYRRDNPKYKPSPELLKLIGVKETGSTQTPPKGPNPNNPWNQLQNAAPKKNNTLMLVALAIGAAFLIRKRK